MTLQFDIGVFAANEGQTIKSCIEALDYACEGHTSRISVLLNGTTDNSTQILKSLKLSNSSLEVHRFPEADKSNAINHFLYSIRDHSAEVHFFIDGYVAVTPRALEALTEPWKPICMHTLPSASPAAAVPRK